MDKSLPRHLDRLAVVYVRQSTMQQGFDPQASTRVPYGLVPRAVAWGWSETRGLGIDEDWGQSGTTAEGRQGCQRLVAEGGLAHVGWGVGVALSRVARASTDWPHLLETWALLGTLSADWDGIDAPSHDHDRLWWGLQGTRREAARHRLTQRMDQGKRHQARRGALRLARPLGDGWDSGGEMACDPDAHVHHVVRLLVRQVDALGTLHALGRYRGQQGIQRGVRRRDGPANGALEWRCPTRSTGQAFLKNPLDAGADAYGRRQVDGPKKPPGRPSRGRVARPPQSDPVVWQDCVPASSPWAQYAQHLARFAANRAHAATLGAVRHGPARLAGVVVCGTCNTRLQGRYGGPRT